MYSHEIRQAIGTWVFERDELHGLKLEPEEWLFLESLGGLLEARAFFYLFECKLTFLLDVHKSNQTDVALEHADPALGSPNVRGNAQAPSGIRRECEVRVSSYGGGGRPGKIGILLF